MFLIKCSVQIHCSIKILIWLTIFWSNKCYFHCVQYIQYVSNSQAVYMMMWEKTLQYYGYVSLLHHVSSLWPAQIRNVGIKIISDCFPVVNMTVNMRLLMSNFLLRNSIYDNSESIWRQPLTIHCFASGTRFYIEYQVYSKICKILKLVMIQK